MVFIGNLRSNTNIGGGDRIDLRSNPNYLRLLHTCIIVSTKGEFKMVVGPVIFGDFGVSFVATVAGRYTRRGGPRRSVRGEPLIVLTRGP